MNEEHGVSKSKRKRLECSWKSEGRVTQGRPVPGIGTGEGTDVRPDSGPDHQSQYYYRDSTVPQNRIGIHTDQVTSDYIAGKSNKNYKCPFIQVDGNRYYADRFYLLKPNGDEPCNAETHSSHSCTCGAQQPPPTLDRARLIQSLDLKAAILGTYTVSPAYVMNLFENIPTLVLHGHKGLESKLSTTSIQNSQRPDVIHKPDPVLSSGSRSVKKEEVPPEEAWFDLHSQVEDKMAVRTLPPTLHMTRILTTWLPPRLSASLQHASDTNRKNASRPIKTSSTCAPRPNDDEVIVVDDSDDENDRIKQDVPPFAFTGVDPAVARKRLSKRGVHHPKFMLLFEKRGSLVVVVSTSNLTSQESLDGVWLQRFTPSNSTGELDENRSPQPAIPRNKIKERRYDGSDFGAVLLDFLQKQSNAAQVGSMLPFEFLRHYLAIDTLDSFRDAFSFQDSQVHLIATIPGDHHGKFGITHLGRKDGMPTFLYGAQRVADVMERLTSPKDQNIKPWLPPQLLSNDDRLILQPTSLGGYWTASDMATLGRTYMGRDAGDSKILESMDIMWPTNDFIQKSVRKPTPSIELCTKVLVPSTPASESEESNGASGYIFLASHVFNTIDVNVISRMVQYSHSNPNQVSSLRAPHFKSYARLFEGNEYALRRDHGVGKAAEMFSWFLLSSACLSRGAQGIPTEDRTTGTDQVSYSNFELGILFCSRLQGNTATDRVYCWKPNHCVCGTSASHKKLIHLPIPYAVRAQPFQSDPDEAHMCKTPYFHEITPESASVGLMALTPYGKMRAAKELFGTIELPDSPRQNKS
ncbi:hypothetical protein MHU86_3796 [Fragilaria crotonensis]|nr:hypothetical protein MHU86_3796 [Fragilaria crotonensis]